MRRHFSNVETRTVQVAAVCRASQMKPERKEDQTVEGTKQLEAIEISQEDQWHTWQSQNKGATLPRQGSRIDKPTNMTLQPVEVIATMHGRCNEAFQGRLRQRSVCTRRPSCGFALKEDRRPLFPQRFPKYWVGANQRSFQTRLHSWQIRDQAWWTRRACLSRRSIQRDLDRTNDWHQEIQEPSELKFPRPEIVPTRAWSVCLLLSLGDWEEWVRVQ